MGVQVYSATHDGQGNPLSAIDKQFISFKYGDREIEEFGLVAVFSSDRLSKNIYGNFSDIVSNTEGVDGQQYWGSYFTPGQLSFNLATDGMTSVQYEDFKKHFCPGETKELILSEFPNRIARARVAAAPTISLLPFESETTFKVAGINRTTRTSLYKGEIRIDFIMDDPYWYAKDSYLTSYSEDNLKIILEDGIPTKEMFSDSICLLADNYYYDGSGIIKNNSGLSLSNIKLYNCGTIKSKPVISFNVNFSLLGNKLYFGNGVENLNIIVGKNSLSLTTPSLITSYNTALEIINNEAVIEGIDILELRQKLRDKIFNYFIRAKAIEALEKGTQYDNNGGLQSAAAFKSYFNTYMSNNARPSSAYIIINSRTGESTISYNGISTSIENAGDMIMDKYLEIEGNDRFNINGQITDLNCQIVEANCALSNFKLEYQYTYI